MWKATWRLFEGLVHERPRPLSVWAALLGRVDLAARVHDQPGWLEDKKVTAKGREWTDGQDCRANWSHYWDEPDSVRDSSWEDRLTRLEDIAFQWKCRASGRGRQNRWSRSHTRGNREVQKIEVWTGSPSRQYTCLKRQKHEGLRSLRCSTVSTWHWQETYNALGGQTAHRLFEDQEQTSWVKVETQSWPVFISKTRLQNQIASSWEIRRHWAFRLKDDIQLKAVWIRVEYAWRSWPNFIRRASHPKKQGLLSTWTGSRSNQLRQRMEMVQKRAW